MYLWHKQEYHDLAVGERPNCYVCMRQFAIFNVPRHLCVPINLVFAYYIGIFLAHEAAQRDLA